MTRRNYLEFICMPAVYICQGRTHRLSRALIILQLGIFAVQIAGGRISILLEDECDFNVASSEV